VSAFLDPEDVEYIKQHVLNREQYSFGECNYDDWTQGIMKIDDATLYPRLVKYTTKMELITGLKLIPKYSFWRMSLKGTRLPYHIDRPPCEISATINIGTSDGSIWPFYADHANKYKFHMSPGDAVVYNGFEFIHWREPLECEWNIQWCIHYTRADGVLADIGPGIRWNEIDQSDIKYAAVCDKSMRLFKIAKELEVEYDRKTKTKITV
jgi:hypothetical protein